MRNVIILGAGGAAAEVTFYINDNNLAVPEEERITILGYLDYSDTYWKKYNFSAPVLSDIDSYIPKPGEEVLVAVGDMDSRIKMIDKLQAKKATIGSFIHHSVIRPRNPVMGVGNIIFPFCIIEEYATIGSFNFLTSYSFISHDCVVGDNNFFSIAGIAGTVTVGNNNYFGIRSLVVPGTKIGNNNIIQAGMVVDKDVQDDTTVFYRYKEKVLAIPKII